MWVCIPYIPYDEPPIEVPDGGNVAEILGMDTEEEDSKTESAKLEESEDVVEIQLQSKLTSNLLSKIL